MRLRKQRFWDPRVRILNEENNLWLGMGWVGTKKRHAEVYTPVTSALSRSGGFERGKHQPADIGIRM